MTTATRPAAAALLTLLLAVAGVRAANAHGQPADLAFWGGFPPDAARCQRTLGRAASVCVSQIAATRAICLGGALSGGTCDDAAVDAAITSARQRALERVQRACTVAELQNLGYVDLQDAFRDVGDACRQLDTAGTSAGYGPAMVGGKIAPVDPATAACVAAGARESSRLLRFAIRAYQTVLDRIAALDLAADEKARLVEWATRRIGRAQASSRANLVAQCSSGDFAVIYHRPVDDFLAGVAGQAACMPQFVYVQNGVVCPNPACGNGIQERGEECDDGNAGDGDGCRTDCTRTDCTVFANTYDLIQEAIFANRACTNNACHGNAQGGGLDLHPGLSYDGLVGVPANIDPDRRRVEPGDAERSLLYLKLAAKTFPDQYPADELGIGSPMPLGTGPGLTPDELEAVWRWIDGGAPRTGLVSGVADLLDICTPPSTPPPQAARPALHG